MCVPPLFFFCFLLSSRILNVFSGSEFSLNIPFAWGFSPFPHPTLSPGQCFGDHLPHCCALYSRCLSHLRILSNISTLRVDLLGLIGLNSFFSFPCNFSETLLFCKMLRRSVRDRVLEIEICSVSLPSCYRICIVFWFFFLFFMYIVHGRMYREKYV